MSDKYDILLQKYNKAVAKAKDLQEQLTLKKEQWQAREDEFNISSKLIRELCESILAKSKDQNTLGKSKSWDSLKLNEMIRLSQKVLKEYNDERTDLMRKVGDELERRGQRIRELEEEKAFLKHHRGKSKEEAEDADLGEDEKEEIYEEKKEKDETQKSAEGKLSPKLQNKIKNGEVTVEMAKEAKQALAEGRTQAEWEEEDDEILEGDKSDKLRKDMMKNNITGKVTTRSVQAFHNPKEIKRRKEMRQSVEDEVYSEKYQLMLEKINDDKAIWTILRVIGETGISRMQELQSKIIDELLTQSITISAGQFTAKIKDMATIGLIKREPVNTPFAKIIIITLTAEGAYIFKRKFDKDYVPSEYDRIIAEHTTLLHGYGIQGCCEKLKDISVDSKKIYVRVDMWNRKKALTTGAADGKSNIKYIPDIVCIDQNNTKTYIEYELDHHTDENLNVKCNKMMMVGLGQLNFIVPNKTIANGICDRLKDWVATKSGSEITRRLTIRVTTAKALEGHDLRQDREWMYVLKPMQDKDFKANF